MSSVTLTPQDYTRYQFIRALAISIVAISTLFAIIIFVFLLIAPNFGLSMLLGLLICDIVIGIAILLLPKGRPIWQLVLPLTMIIGIGVVASALVFADAKASIMTVFLVVILLASVTGNSRITLGSVIVCGLLVVGIVLVPPIPGITPSLGILLPIVQVSALISTFVLVWLINDRQTSALTTAMDLTSQRAVEAEAARAQAEKARIEVEQRNEEQARLLELVQTLEIPVIPIGQNILVMPLVGNLDSRRADAIQRRLLDEVTRLHAHTVVLDVTGISIVDTAVARQLLRTAQAVRLLGARTLLSGITATVAQTLVGLGVELDDLTPVSDLGQALEKARQT